MSGPCVKMSVYVYLLIAACFWPCNILMMGTHQRTNCTTHALDRSCDVIVWVAFEHTTFCSPKVVHFSRFVFFVCLFPFRATAVMYVFFYSLCICILSVCFI